MPIFLSENSRFWQPWCSDPAKYAVGVDSDVGYKNSRSGFVQSINANPKDWGCLLQSIDAYEYRGKRVSFSAKAKTLEVDGEAGIFLIVASADKSILLQDAMTDRFLAGSVDWTDCTAVLDVPDSARYIKFGAILVGTGRIWIDDLVIREVDFAVQTTDRRFWPIIDPTEIPVKIDFSPVLLNNDSNRPNLLKPTGWFTVIKGPTNYEVTIETAATATSDMIPSVSLRSMAKQVDTVQSTEMQLCWLSQHIVAIDFRRKRIRFTALLKTRDVAGWCGLTMHLKGATNKSVACSDTWKNAISGSQDWTEYSAVLDVPETTYYATISVTLRGEGCAWVSQLRMEEVTDIPTTDRDSEAGCLDFDIEE